MNFHETVMGKQFFNRQLPQLIRALDDIAKAKAQPAPVIRLPESGMEDILAELYNVRYMPECHLVRENDPLNQDVHDALHALLKSLSPEQQDLFAKYEEAENARGDSISEQAYKDGARLAIQLMMAGCAGPANDEKAA